jgi:hypothetical protein
MPVSITISTGFAVITFKFCYSAAASYFRAGEMAERSNAAVLKTVEVKASGGSNPSLSATINIKRNQKPANH